MPRLREREIIMSLVSRIGCDWAIRCFGREHVFDRAIRALRTLEEAAELAQALGVPEDKAAKCISTVYSRPVGEPLQEIGGVLLTIAVLCESMGAEADDILEIELRRVLKKDIAHFTKRNQEKLDLGLDSEVVTTIRTAAEIEAERLAAQGCTGLRAKDGHLAGCPLARSFGEHRKWLAP